MATVCRYQGVTSLRVGSPRVRRLKLPGDRDTVGAATFSTDGNVVAASGIGGVLAVDLFPRPKLSPAELDSRGDEIMALDGSGRRFAVARGHTLEIWDRQKGQRSFILEAPRREIFSALLFSRDGKVLAAGAGDGAIMLWDVGTRESLAPPMNGHRRSISGLSFSNDGNLRNS